MEGADQPPDDLIEGPSGGFSLLSRAAPRLSWLVVLGLLAAAAAFVLLGPWTLIVNAVVIVLALFVVFTVLDIV